MKKGFFRTVFFLALVGLSFSLVIGQQNPILASDKPIVIGGSLPQTGKFAETAKWIEKGMRFWAEEINAKGGLLGRKVVFKIYDDESSVGKAVTFAEKAITVDKVDLLSADTRAQQPVQ